MAGHDEQHEQQQDERQAGAHGGSSSEQRRRWRQRALWLSQLGLAPDDAVPVEAVEEVAGAALALLDELEQLETTLRLERAAAPRNRRWPRG
jgi:hypothetical protein